MGMVVDLTIIAIIALSTFLAYRKGLVKLAIGLCAFVISIVITVILYQPISNLVINVTAIDEMIEDVIYEKANGVIQEDTEENEFTNQIVQSAKEEMLPEVARELAVNIVRGGVMIILFIASKIALKFITAIADAIAKLPIIDQINKTSGMIFGILRGILIVYVGLLILTISGQINPNNRINSSVQESLIGKTMYENNILKIFF